MALTDADGEIHSAGRDTDRCVSPVEANWHQRSLGLLSDSPVQGPLGEKWGYYGPLTEPVVGLPGGG
jgi:hypothetical protein